eukprot:3702879-Prymnesium_polylepis.1
MAAARSCRACPELVSLVGADAVSALDEAAFVGDESARDGAIREALRRLFGGLMGRDAEDVGNAADALMRRVDATMPMLRTPVSRDARA